MTDWIEKAIKRPGAFEEKAERAGESTQEYAREVTDNPQDYNERTERQARLAETLAKVRKYKKSRG